MTKKEKTKFIWRRGVLAFGIPVSLITSILTELLNSGTIVFDYHFLIKLSFYLIFMGFGAGLSWGYVMF